MAGIFGFHTREAIRVKVKKCEGLLQPEYRKFSVDPQITSFEVLQSLLARAFDIKGEFTISYLAKDENGQEVYLSMLSDWDLDAAFLSSSDPSLRLKVDLKPFEEGLEDWDIIRPLDIPQPHISAEHRFLPGTILNQMEKTFSYVQRAFNLSDNEAYQQPIKLLKRAMSDAEFHNFLDSDGRLIKPQELRLSVYQGGVEPSLRKVVWRHILNVFPHGMTGAERMDYMKQKSQEYCSLRDTWQKEIKKGRTTDEIMYITNMVRKDVLRTDRTHKFYAGSDDNKNVVSLFNILTTYALSHPDVSYCQGMSDIASPLLVIMKDEANAYICFCALMKRLKPNFMIDGEAMTKKFQQLSELLQYYDAEFYEYLKQNQADDLLFCYRWLLLELKREFAFDDALIMLEVMWSSLPPDPPEKEIALTDKDLSQISTTQSPKFFTKETPYTKLCAIRKASSFSQSHSLKSITITNSAKTEQKLEVLNGGSAEGSPDKSQNKKLNRTDSACMSDSELSMDDSSEYLQMSISMTRELRMELANLNSSLPGKYLRYTRFDSEESETPTSTEGRDFSGKSFDHSDDIQEVSEQQVSDTERDVSEMKGSDSDTDFPDISCVLDEVIETPVKRVKPKNSLDEEQNQIHEEVIVNGKNEDEEDVTIEVENKKVAVKTIINCNIEKRNCMNALHILNHSKNEWNKDADDEDGISECGPQLNRNSEVRTKTEEWDLEMNSSESYSNNTNTKANEESLHSSSDSPRHPAGIMDSGVTDLSTPFLQSCEDFVETTNIISYHKNVKDASKHLPPPQEFGGGNPFMMFLCLTLLLQHRDHIMKNKMDYNDLAMHFDKMVRKHNVNRVLHQARSLFTEYLQHCKQEENSDELSDLSV